MYVRPHPFTIVGSTIVGILVAALGISYAASSTEFPLVLTTLLVAGGGFIAVRAPRLGIKCSTDEAIVRGFVITRTISRASISRIRGGGEAPLWSLGWGRMPPTIEWVDSRGRARKSRLWMVSSLTAYQWQLDVIGEHAAENLCRLKEWRKFGRLD